MTTIENHTDLEAAKTALRTAAKEDDLRLINWGGTDVSEIDLAKAVQEYERIELVQPNILTKKEYSYFHEAGVTANFKDNFLPNYETMQSYFHPSFRPMQHQLRFLEFCNRAGELEKGGILGDDMGLGKTVQMVLAGMYRLLFAPEGNQCSCVVFWTPSRKLHNQIYDWFYAMFTVTATDGTGPTRTVEITNEEGNRKVIQVTKLDSIIQSKGYEIRDPPPLKRIIFCQTETTAKAFTYIQPKAAGGVQRQQRQLVIQRRPSDDIFNPAKWKLTSKDLVFVDEGDKLRKEGTSGEGNKARQMAKFLLNETPQLAIWIVTGTPIALGLRGLASLLLLARAITETNADKASNIVNALNACMLRRTISDKAMAALFEKQHVPSYTEYHIPVVPNPSEMQTITATSQPDQNKSLHQLYLGCGTAKPPNILEDGYVWGITEISEKEMVVVRACVFFQSMGEQTIVVCSNKWPQSRFYHLLTKHNVGCVLLAETDSGDKARSKALTDFQAHKFSVLIITYPTGSRGINLQFCRNLILTKYDYNPAEIEQVRRRIVRINGSYDHCRVFVVYYVFTREDFVWNETIKLRQEVSKGAMSSTNTSSESGANASWNDYQTFYMQMLQKAVNLKGKWTTGEHKSSHAYSMITGDVQRIAPEGVTSNEKITYKPETKPDDIVALISFVAALAMLTKDNSQDPIDVTNGLLHIFTHYFYLDFRNYAKGIEEFLSGA